MEKNRSLILLFALIISLTGCYHRQAKWQQLANVQFTDHQVDSILFAKTHHYSQNYNFVVEADSLVLTKQMPEEAVSQLPTDSFSVIKNQILVVADIRILPNDSIDSVWVQLAHEQGMFGWIHEGDMLKAVHPDNPISRFISFFSDVHLLIFLIVIVTLLFAYGMHRLLRHKAYIVHFNDIETFYPTLTALMVSISATLYASIQMYATEEWREFFFHPSLNPFSETGLLRVFLLSVWGILIVGIAAVDDVFRHLSVGQAVLYLLGLAGVCAVDYIIFTITTMFYVGYFLLAAYLAFAVWQYLTKTVSRFICGNCGLQIKKKGKCPHCGAINV